MSYVAVIYLLRPNYLHGGLVPAGPSVRREGKTPSGSVVKCHTDTPQVYAHAVGLLMRLTQHSALIHVRVLHTETNTHTVTRAHLQRWIYSRHTFIC